MTWGLQVSFSVESQGSLKTTTAIEDSLSDMCGDGDKLALEFQKVVIAEACIPIAAVSLTFFPQKLALKLTPVNCQNLANAPKIQCKS